MCVHWCIANSFAMLLLLVFIQKHQLINEERDILKARARVGNGAWKIMAALTFWGQILYEIAIGFFVCFCFLWGKFISFFMTSSFHLIFYYITRLLWKIRTNSPMNSQWIIFFCLTLISRGIWLTKCYATNYCIEEDWTIWMLIQ